MWTNLDETYINRNSPRALHRESSRTFPQNASLFHTYVHTHTYSERCGGLRAKCLLQNWIYRQANPRGASDDIYPQHDENPPNISSRVRLIQFNHETLYITLFWLLLTHTRFVIVECVCVCFYLQQEVDDTLMISIIDLIKRGQK